MPGQTSYSKATSWLCLFALTASFAGPAAAQSSASVAEDFLSKVERGDTSRAFEMLSASAKEGHSPSDLKAPPRDSASTRRVAFQGPVDAKEVGQHDGSRYYIVCMIDVPSGSGAVTNIAVTVQADSRIADYRYDSHPSPACASRM